MMPIDTHSIPHHESDVVLSRSTSVHFDRYRYAVPERNNGDIPVLMVKQHLVIFLEHQLL